MKVWLLRRRYSTVGGAEHFTQRLAVTLHSKGYEVCIMAESWPKSQDEIYRVEKVPSKNPASYARACYHTLFSHQDGLIFSLERTFRQHVFRAGDGVHASWLERRRPYQSVFQRLGSAWSQKHRTILELEKQVFVPHATDWVIANSQMVKREIINYFSFPEERIQVIYPGVDMEYFHPCLDKNRQIELRCVHGVPEDSIVWCFVGSGFERKGLAWAIQMAALQQNPKIWLLVLGKGRRAPFLRVAEKCGFSERLRFVAEETSGRDVYHISDAFILPTLYDPCSNASLEAAACGLPVITTIANGAAELTDGIVLKNPSQVAENAERCRIYARRLQPVTLPSDLQRRLDEGPCWDAILQLLTNLRQKDTVPRLRDGG